MAVFVLLIAPIHGFGSAQLVTVLLVASFLRCRCLKSVGLKSFGARPVSRWVLSMWPLSITIKSLKDGAGRR